MTNGDDLLPLLTASEMREWERRSFAGGDVSERVILESAGRAAAVAIAREFPEGKVVGAIGSGNNGGDAIVALRTLKAWGRDVAAIPVTERTLPTSLSHGWELPLLESMTEGGIAGAGVLVDGILGTGASGGPREPQVAAIHAMNASGIPIVAIDGPTGVDLTTGEVASEAIRAVLTVTFGALKRGLLLHPGRTHAGRILLAEVGFPPYLAKAGAMVLTDAWAGSRLPSIPPDAHKGKMGLVAVVAGRRGFAGAAIMAAMGALRAGAGGVRLVSSEDNRVLLQTGVPEAVFVERSDPDMADRLAGVSAVLVGPGIGTDEPAVHLLTRVVELEVPLVLDADALTLLSRIRGLLPPRRAQSSILTPHPGEMSRLLGCSIKEVLSDRFGTTGQAAKIYACSVLAKGAPSLVAAPGEPIMVGSTGHSGVATGGMGDTLGGIIAAFLAHGMEPRECAATALHFAGRAAEIAGRGRGLIPRDIADALPAALLGSGGNPIPQPPFLYELEEAR